MSTLVPIILSVLVNLTETRSLVKSSDYGGSTTEPPAQPDRYWSEWSECSVTCGEGEKIRRLCEGDTCDNFRRTEKSECNEAPCTDAEWSEWSACDTEIKLMTRTRCDEDKLVGCQEEYLDCEVEGEGSWGEFGECVDGLQEREMCDDYGCEIEEKECGDIGEIMMGFGMNNNHNQNVVGTEGDNNQDAIDLLEWGMWGTCTKGYRLRKKCLGTYCPLTEETVCKDEGWKDGSWSEWGSCEEGKKSRTRTSGLLGLELEETYCHQDQDKFSGMWSLWGPCSSGWETRERCIVGYGCFVEERKCKGSVAMEDSSHWTQWGMCKNDFQERERCGYEGCEVDSRFCGKKGDSNWGEWTPCSNDVQERSRCDGDYGCYTEERRCIYDRKVVLEPVTPTPDSGSRDLGSLASNTDSWNLWKWIY
eukprot:GFUD01021955.1.p1 GENE.GFUD01021955.1~~GFUD01021955.1.p1  ORF type:complete len:419 (+),score=93.18 GFUD01021955.1:100-1356(+)